MSCLVWLFRVTAIWDTGKKAASKIVSHLFSVHFCAMSYTFSLTPDYSLLNKAECVSIPSPDLDRRIQKLLLQ